MSEDSMLGAIAGDIAGSIYEGHPLSTDKNSFPLFAPGCRFTDDTVMTLAVAEGVRLGYRDPQKTAFITRQSMRSMGRRYLNAGYGSRFFQWLLSEGTEPINSFGNGSAMRTSPVAWAYDSLEDFLSEFGIKGELLSDCEEREASFQDFVNGDGEGRLASRYLTETLTVSRIKEDEDY